MEKNERTENILNIIEEKINEDCIEELNQLYDYDITIEEIIVIVFLFR